MNGMEQYAEGYVMALCHELTAARQTIIALAEALHDVDEMWGSDKEWQKELEACKVIGQDFPVTIVWQKLKDALTTHAQQIEAARKK